MSKDLGSLLFSLHPAKMSAHPCDWSFDREGELFSLFLAVPLYQEKEQTTSRNLVAKLIIYSRYEKDSFTLRTSRRTYGV